MNDTDTLPWYRQFWPWFLILLPASAVVASLYTVSLAYRTTDSFVTQSGDGMDVVTERHLAAERHAADLGVAAELVIDTNTGAINATLHSRGDADWPRTVELLFSHPTDVRRDQRITLTAAIPASTGQPVYAGHVVNVPDGRWYVVLSSGDTWRLSGEWYGESALRLLPAGRTDDGGS
ncbi:MAG: FixH family protein [Woeseiaceae bacterium]|nr:FixH family protein [Woeseiaceae bacterium]